jgi:hypothetical protein
MATNLTNDAAAWGLGIDLDLDITSRVIFKMTDAIFVI